MLKQGGDLDKFIVCLYIGALQVINLTFQFFPILLKPNILMKKLSVSSVLFFKRTTLILFIFTTFFSCTKDSPDKNDSYHVTCTIDGIDLAFNVNSNAHIDTLGNLKDLMINGFTASDSTTAAVGFVITNVPSEEAFLTGTYDDRSTKFEVLASFAPNIMNTHYEAGTTFYEEATDAGVTITNHFTTTITSWTSETVTGTFSGDFYYGGDPNGHKVTITNGDFYVKLQ